MMLYPGSMLAQPLLTLVMHLTVMHRDMKDVLNLMMPKIQKKTPPCSMGDLMATGPQ